MVVAFLSVITVNVLGKSSTQQNLEIKTNQPFIATITQKVVATGRIRPRKEVEIKSQVSGVIDEIFVTRGQEVSAGDKLALIRLVPDAEHLNRAIFEVDNAKSRYARALRELVKHQELFEKKMISHTTLSKFELERDLLKEQLDSAENNVNLIKGNESNNEVAISNLVTATTNGVVLDIPVKEGFYITRTNTFSDGTTIAYVADMNDLIFEGLVDEFEVGSLSNGMNLEVKVAVFGDEIFEARLETISLRGEWDQGIMKFEVEAGINETKGFLLRSGYSATADIILQKRKDVLAINEGDIHYEGENKYIEVLLEDGRFDKQPIETGLSDGINVEIISGVMEKQKYRDL